MGRNVGLKFTSFHAEKNSCRLVVLVYRHALQSFRRNSLLKRQSQPETEKNSPNPHRSRSSCWCRRKACQQ